MTNGQFNYLRMFLVRRGILNANQVIVTGNAKLAAYKQLTEQIFAQILADAGIQESDITGTTNAKNTAWAIAVEYAVHVCKGMRSYADDIGNQILHEMMHYQKSDLDRGEQQDILDRMNLIYQQAGLVPIANLAFVNITAPVLTSYNNAITAFSNSVPQHGIMQASKKTSTANIKKNFALLRKNGKKMNNLVDTFTLIQPDFVKTYKNSCIIINYGKAQMAEEKHLMPEEHVALFKGKFMPGDTFTVRNHSKLAAIKVFLSDNENVPNTEGIEIEATKDLKLSIPKAFKMPFGHTLIVLNKSAIDDAQVTVILAHGKSHSSAMEPMLGNPVSAV